MKWLKRCCWLAVWGVWVWMGFGLYRELPKRLVVERRLPVQKEDLILGFLKGTNHVAFVQNVTNWETSIKVFDAATGSLVRETPAPPFNGFAWFPDDGDDPPLVYVNHPISTLPGAEQGLREYNLATGVWRKVCDERHLILGIDRRLQIALCIESNVVVRALTFLDLKTGKPLFVREVSNGWGYIASAQVIKGSGLAVIPLAIWPRRASQAEKMILEVWKLGPSITLEKIIDVTGHFALESSTESGLLPLPRDGRPTVLDVYDLKSDRWAYRGPAHNGDPPSAKHYEHAWTISSSGRTASDGLALWDLESGERLWRASPHEFPSLHSRDRFLVKEQWSDYWKKWAPSRTLETYALRNMENGELIYRSVGSEESVPRQTNDESDFAVASNGNIYRLPLQTNWPLLALCHLILALPLVLLWTVFWWRQRRRARRLAAAP